MNILISILLLITSYLLGSVPFGLIIGKVFKKIDIREHGSKNLGATNAARVLGMKWGILVFLLDALKGASVVAVLRIFKLSDYYIFNIANNAVNFVIIYGIFAVIGHLFPIFAKFKGGKAVATTLGVVLAVSPITGIAGFSAFLLILFITGYSSLGSTTGALVAIGYMILDLLLIKFEFKGGFILNSVTIIGIVIMVITIFYKHMTNIKKLLTGKENQFSFALIKRKNKNEEKSNTEK